MNVTLISPTNGQKNVLRDSSVEFDIIDADSEGLDLLTLQVLLNDSFFVKDGQIIDSINNVASSVSWAGDNLSVSLQPEEDFDFNDLIELKIQIQNIEGAYLNFQSIFQTIKKEPQLISSSPEENGTIQYAQFIYLKFEDLLDGVDSSTLDVTINNIAFITNGIESNYCGPLTTITTADESLIVKIDAQDLLIDGNYLLNYSVQDTLGNTGSGRLRFKVKYKEITLPNIFPQTEFVGFVQGIERAEDLGTNGEVEISFPEIKGRNYKTEQFGLVYYSKNRLAIFDSLPKVIVINAQGTVISELENGQPYSFAVRSMEIYKELFDPAGMVETYANTYEVPATTSLSTTLSEEDDRIYVDSVAGYPDSAFLLVDEEIIRYIAVDRTDKYFTISNNGRGVSGTTIKEYTSGEAVSLFFNCNDQNTNIISATPTFEDGYGYNRQLNGIGTLVPDYSDEENKDFQSEDFCGYHRTSPDLTLSGKDDCGSYLGGEWNGSRGISLFEQMQAREETLLDTTGEPVMLLKRIWSGRTCPCLNLRRVHPKMKSCEDCYGTGFEGGFTQYNYLKRNDTLIMMHFNETVEDLRLGAHEHLMQEMEPNTWTLPNPVIKDRDLIVRFSFSGEREYIYEVLNSSREKSLLRNYTRQKLNLKRLDKTDPVYMFPIIIPSNFGQK